ncbi:hypothetical protein [Natronococcus sp.]|uniref:hypothetical protein n=1 Tax=Natronococcus sp. TaxID=35747 RepID=UPI0025D1B0CF|nr:hypothetical protein [Natronococcus sp.]
MAVTTLPIGRALRARTGDCAGGRSATIGSEAAAASHSRRPATGRRLLEEVVRRR